MYAVIETEVDRLIQRIKANYKGDWAVEMDALEKLVSEGIFGCGAKTYVAMVRVKGLEKN